MIYKGFEIEHWREPFEGNNCSQVFLHYNDLNSNYKENTSLIKDPLLDCLNDFKGVKINFNK